MKEKKTCEDCGKNLRAPNTGPLCFKCGKKSASSGKARAGRARKKHAPNSYGRHAKPNGGLTLTVPATNELCDERWQELGLDVKVRLLNSVSE